MQRVLKVMLVPFLFNAAVAAAQVTPKYSPHSGYWETVQPDSNLNPPPGQWNYAAPNATPPYNPHENRRDMAPPDSQQCYNPHDDRRETMSPDPELQHNPHQNNWRYLPNSGRWDPR
jgi:hypothetical protein